MCKIYDNNYVHVYKRLPIAATYNILTINKILNKKDVAPFAREVTANNVQQLYICSM